MAVGNSLAAKSQKPAEQKVEFEVKKVSFL